MKIGFTGTRHGMRPAQLVAFETVLSGLRGTEFHHGDCIGADFEAGVLAFTHGLPVIVHPPKDEAHRAFSRAFNEILPPLTHLARNRAIVNACDVLIGCPFELEHQPRGGTWYTIDYARKQGKTVKVCWPNGEVQEL